MSRNPVAHLDPDVSDLSKLVLTPTRDGYGEGLVIAGKINPNLVVLCADLTESTRCLPFKKAFPDRFIQMGVSEQSLVAIAAGLALAGKTPWVASYAMFCPGRAWEQIRTNVALNNANVKIAGAHAGVSVGPDGATHQAIEDIAITRTIPNLVVIAPADAIETRKAVVLASASEMPTYVRFAREKTPVFTTEKTPFVIGTANVLWNGTNAAIIACGPLVHNALLAAVALEKEGISVRVLNMHTIKPLDAVAIESAARECGAIVTVEEHQIIGGLGSAVCECVAENVPVPVLRIGVRDRFGESGTPLELIEHLGMGVEAIKKAVHAAIALKK